MAQLANRSTKKNETVYFMNSFDDLVAGNSQLTPTNYDRRISGVFKEPAFTDGECKVFVGPNRKDGKTGNAIFVRCTKTRCCLCTSSKSEYPNSRKWDFRNCATFLSAHLKIVDEEAEEEVPNKANKANKKRARDADAPKAPAPVKSKGKAPAKAKAATAVVAPTTPVPATATATAPEPEPDAHATDAPADDPIRQDEVDAVDPQEADEVVVVAAAAAAAIDPREANADAGEDESDEDSPVVSLGGKALTIEVRRLVRLFGQQYVNTVSKDISMLQNKVNELTAIIGRARGKRIGKVAMPIHDKGDAPKKGECAACHLSTKLDSGNAMKPSWVLHCAFGGNVRDPARGTSTDADVSVRTIDADKLHQTVLIRQRMCIDCTTAAQGANKCAAFDLNNKKSTCAMCRHMRSHNATTCCKDCDIYKLQTDHANHKMALHNAFSLLANVVGEIRDVVTSKNLDKSNLKKAELDVMPYGMHDFGVIVTLHDNSKIVFVIEVMATKVEELPKLAHKFAMARHKYADKGAAEPTKFVLVIFDIDAKSGGYTLPERIEVLRRWMIFACRYPNLIPRVNNWWMHFGNSRSPYNNMNAPTTQEFFKNPVMIEHAPRGGSVYPPDTCDTDGDWAFATDPYMIKTMQKVSDQAVSVYEMLFYKSVDVGGSSNATFKDTRPLVYSQYNVDKDGYDVALSCKAGCEICTGLSEGRHILPPPEAEAEAEEAVGVAAVAAVAAV
jgi:hypothetical protein